jgi:hypothetical protein
MSAELLRELAHVKAVFQLRTIEAVIRGPSFPRDGGGETKVAPGVSSPNQQER